MDISVFVNPHPSPVVTCRGNGPYRTALWRRIHRSNHQDEASPRPPCTRHTSAVLDASCCPANTSQSISECVKSKISSKKTHAQNEMGRYLFCLAKLNVTDLAASPRKVERSSPQCVYCASQQRPKICPKYELISTYLRNKMHSQIESFLRTVQV